MVRGGPQEPLVGAYCVAPYPCPWGSPQLQEAGRAAADGGAQLVQGVIQRHIW